MHEPPPSKNHEERKCGLARLTLHIPSKPFQEAYTIRFIEDHSACSKKASSKLRLRERLAIPIKVPSLLKH